ncbi:MAG: hypothetical protein JNK98_05160 [Chitinophagaceae bacterium]|nr:hypothetical protein [Chitinophagaceae bacterium]
MAETSKYYRFKPVSNDLLKSIFTYDNSNLLGCNIYKPNDSNKDMYAWVRSDSLKFFDLIEERFSAEEVQIEEMAIIDKSLDYTVIRDVP